MTHLSVCRGVMHINNTARYSCVRFPLSRTRRYANRTYNSSLNHAHNFPVRPEFVEGYLQRKPVDKPCPHSEGLKAPDSAALHPGYLILVRELLTCALNIMYFDGLSTNGAI